MQEMPLVALAHLVQTMWFDNALHTPYISQYTCHACDVT